MNKLALYFKNPSIILRKGLMKFGALVPDTIYIKLMYRLFMDGERINLENPITFNEKLQWLKLYDRDDANTLLVDKYAVKDYVSGVIGKEYVIPTIGVWDRVSEIDWEKLPSQFVLKTTHGGSGNGVVICKDKEHLDKDEACRILDNNLKTNLYWRTREWPYKNVKKRIIAETLLCDSSSDEIKDYKFFCFNGKVKVFKIDFGRFVEHHANYYDCEGNLLDLGEAALPPDPNHIEKIPSQLPKMIQLSEELAVGHDFIRVDLYYVNEKIYFGELTFFPVGGYGKFTDKKWDKILGDWLVLSKKRRDV